MQSAWVERSRKVGASQGPRGGENENETFFDLRARAWRHRARRVRHATADANARANAGAADRNTGTAEKSALAREGNLGEHGTHADQRSRRDEEYA